MDNKAYLDEIAVKGKKKFSAGPIFSPLIIKLIIAAAIAVIAMIIIGNVIGGRNEEIAVVHEKVYARISSFANDKSPFEAYTKKLKSSTLRAYATQLQNSAQSTKTSIESAASAIGLNTGSLSSEAVSDNSRAISNLEIELEEAFLSGTLDKSFASNAEYHITILINLEKQARTKANNASYAEALDKSIADLQLILDNFTEYSIQHQL